MTKPVEKITIGSRQYSKFIRYPKQVRDGTVRCICCGQIDEPGYHDDSLCRPFREAAYAGASA